MFVFFLLIMPLASAEIILSQLKSVYSLGDNLALSVEVSEVKSGFLRVDLKCEENQANLYNSIISQKKVDLNIPLTRTHIGELVGNCKVMAGYSGQSVSSPEFKVSNVINVVINIDRFSAKPGEEVLVKGTASKENGGVVGGFIEIILEGTDISVLRNIDKGEFEVKLALPENIAGKEYNLQIKVYEKLGEEITNQGILNRALVVAQQPSKIDISINKQTIIPGEELKFKVILYDQANNQISGEIEANIKDPEEEIGLNKMIQSGQEEKYKIESNFAAGYWTIEASSFDVSAKRLFYVEENEEAEFKLENSTLVIRNIGNVPYQKAVQIVIGNELEIRQMDLDVGEESKFRLVAPDGEYEVKVSDGTRELEFGKISLTGNVIGVQDIIKAAGPLGRYPIVWIFLILVFALFVLMLFNKVVKKKFVGWRPSFKHKKVERDKRGEINLGEQIGEGEAEHTLVLKGNKENSAVLALKLKNISKDLTEQASREIKARKGVVYNAGDYLLGIFIPSITKTNENELSAVKVAREIEKNLGETEFGLGINTGNIISKKEAGKLKFTSLGNALNLAKKMANLSKNEILLSEESSKKAMNTVKTEKTERDGVEAYKITRIVDREKYNKFVSEFLRKQEKEKK